MSLILLEDTLEFAMRSREMSSNSDLASFLLVALSWTDSAYFMMVLL